MKSFTTTGERNGEECLRRNWRGNACSKHGEHKKSKGSIGTWTDEVIGNKNYRRKKSDRSNKKSYRAKLKEKLRNEVKDL